MRKAMRLRTEKELLALRSRIENSEAVGATVSPKAYALQSRLEARIAASHTADQRFREFIEGRS